MTTDTTDPIAAAMALIEPLTEYTPEPWRAAIYDNVGFINVPLSGYDGDFKPADARLMAAAPDLREMVATLADALEAERAKVAAAYEAAACVTVDMGPRYDGRSVHYHIPERVKGAIRSLTPADAQAALGKMLAEARAEAAEAALTAAAGGA